MLRIQLLLILGVLTPSCVGQTPLFQGLDGPIPGNVVVDAAGDLDGDGDEDLVTNISVYANDGHGRFAPAGGTQFTFNRAKAFIADMNGDGLKDIVSITSSLLTVRIDLNAGGLVFVPVTGLPFLGVPGPPIRDLDIADVDGDGDMDVLIVINAFNGSFTGSTSPRLWLNDGSAMMTDTPAAVPTVTVPSNWVFLRDLDADGDPDAVFGGMDQAATLNVRVATNVAGSFTLSPAVIWNGAVPNAVAMGNMNNDSFPDIILSTGAPPAAATVIILNNGAGFLAPVVTPAPTHIWTLIATDVDGNGIDDLVQGGSPYSVSVHLVGAGATIGPAVAAWSDIFVTPFARDLDGDGDRDLVARASGASVLLMCSTPGGSMVRVGGRNLGVTLFFGQQAGDAEADGDRDFLGFSSSGAIASALNDGRGFFSAGTQTPITLPVVAPNYSLIAFDRDGDGDSDLYAARKSQSYTTGPTDDLLFDNSNGVFQQLATVPGAGLTSSALTADFDADGDRDIVLGRRTAVANPAGPMLFLANVGPSGFAPPIPIGTSHTTYDVDVGDFDGNGFVDVFQTNHAFFGPPAPADPSVLYLNFGGSYAALPTPLSGYVTAAADLDGDGLTDIVMDGQVHFSTGAAFTPGPMLTSALAAPASLADVDEDGDLDLVESPGTVMFNLGGAAFGAPVSYLDRFTSGPLAWSASESSIVDVDQDGDRDIVAHGPIVVVNTLRQIARGAIPRPGRPCSFDLYGTPNGTWFLWAAAAPASIPFAPWGNVMIDPASAGLLALGVYTGPAAAMPGTASFVLITPNVTGLVGYTAYLQAIDLGTTRFTNSLQVQVMGY